MLDSLLERFHQGQRRALTRLLSLLARGEHTLDILSALEPTDHRARVVAVTGSAGVGKSTLIGKLIPTIRATGKTVAVLACDPQSPLSGGALLGDRFRMPSEATDEGVFIRSISTPGGQGAVTEHLPEMIRLLQARRFDVILIETVGAGQGDTLARKWVDVMVLLVQPETGDDLQWEKAGVLEVADLVVVHKADLPSSDRVEAQMLSMLELSPPPVPKILRVSSKGGDSIDALWRAVEEVPLRSGAEGEGELLLRLLLDKLTEKYRRAEEASDPELRAILERRKRGECTVSEAVRELAVRLMTTPAVRMANEESTEP